MAHSGDCMVLVVVFFSLKLLTTTLLIGAGIVPTGSGKASVNHADEWSDFLHQQPGNKFEK